MVRKARVNRKCLSDGSAFRRATLPMEMLVHICRFLHGSPRHVFLVMKAAKGLRALLDSEWWSAFWVLHRRIVGVKFRRYFPRDFTLSVFRPTQYSHILRIIYGLRCECCGGRWGHRIIGLMKLRMCGSCMHDRFISNRVLYSRYFLNVVDILMENAHIVNYLPLKDYRRTDSDFKRMTRNELDLDAFSEDTRKKVPFLFVWFDDVCKLHDMESLAVAQRGRVAGLNVIKAAMRRLRVQYLWSNTPRHALSIILKETVSVKIRPDHSWVVGGPLRQGDMINSLHGKPEINRETVRLLHCQRQWEILRSFIVRPFIGFGEVCGKTWLEKFQGTVPPPDEIRHVFVISDWKFPRKTFDLKTLRAVVSEVKSSMLSLPSGEGEDPTPDATAESGI
jgi:hypothetical protein